MYLFVNIKFIQTGASNSQRHCCSCVHLKSESSTVMHRKFFSLSIYYLTVKSTQAVFPEIVKPSDTFFFHFPLLGEKQIKLYYILKCTLWKHIMTSQFVFSDTPPWLVFQRSVPGLYQHWSNSSYWSLHHSLLLF